MTQTRYHPGGFVPDAPAQNRAERWDGDTGTYTAWDDAGAVVESRALTAQEMASLTPPTPPPPDPAAAIVPALAQIAADPTTTQDEKVAAIIDTLAQAAP